MEKQRQIKILAIVALMLAIAGMSLGFAAFSTTLNISSSASVNPNSEDFKIYFSSSSSSLDLEGLDVFVTYETSNGASEIVTPILRSTSITDVNVSFTEPNQSITYIFYAHNVGEYDAFLNGISFNALDNGKYVKCSAAPTDDTKATESLVNSACSGIKVTIGIGDTDYDVYSSAISGHILSKNSVEEIRLKIEYLDGSSIADGPFNVQISDFKLNYSTVDSPDNLISFTISGKQYYAEDGMTWGEWAGSKYDTLGFEFNGNNLFLNKTNYLYREGYGTIISGDESIISNGVYYCSQTPIM